jgi:peptide deformylase
MAVREVLRLPHPSLKARARELGPDDAEEIARVGADLLDTMRDIGHATGIAANQIDELVRICAVNVEGHRRTTTCHGELLLVNPVMVEAAGAEVGREGCLSIPELTANVRRATEIVVEAVDLAGDPVRIATEGFEARAIQHEIDHLDGLLFLDRVDSLATDVFRRKEFR